jgi:hypothetical protein
MTHVATEEGSTGGAAEVAPPPDIEVTEGLIAAGLKAMADPENDERWAALPVRLTAIYRAMLSVRGKV